MATLLDELSELISTLEENEIEYAVCGGLALTIHGFVRASYGIDILIRPESLEKVYKIVAESGFDIREPNIYIKEKGVEIICVSKLLNNDEILPLKILLVTSFVEDVWETREELEWQEKSLWIVSKNGLIKMKELADRDKDLIDIGKLKK